VLPARQSKGNLAARRRSAQERSSTSRPGRGRAASDLGERQARAFGAGSRRSRRGARPAAVVCSPSAHAETPSCLLGEAGGALGRVEVDFDERLRDRELGVLDTLTTAGVLARHPQEAERRKLLGKFYHRPPAAESWSDVCLRLRSVLADLHRLHGKERVLLVTHEVPVLLVRYLLEGMSEQEVLALGRATEYANCGLTSYDLGADGELQLSAFNYTVPVEQQGERVTEESDAPSDRAEANGPETVTPLCSAPGRCRCRTRSSSDKSDRGSVLIVGGAARTPGAVMLAGVAALRAGAGKLQLGVAASAAAGMALAVPEAPGGPVPQDASSGLDRTLGGRGARVAAVRGRRRFWSARASTTRTGRRRCSRRWCPLVPDDVPVVLDAFALGCLGTDPALGRPCGDGCC
jgi:broad specificity phosphatase PhoE